MTRSSEGFLSAFTGTHAPTYTDGMLASDLRAGDTFPRWANGTYRLVRVLRDPEPYSDQFGDGVKVWCRDETTHREGWLLYGPEGRVYA